jgi:hypothetical protein
VRIGAVLRHGIVDGYRFGVVVTDIQGGAVGDQDDGNRNAERRFETPKLPRFRWYH